MSETVQLPADWRERIANHFPSVAGEQPPYGLRGLLAEVESWPRVQVPASETTTHEVRHSPTSRSTHAGTVERCGLCNPTTATSEPNDWTPPEDHDCWICEKPDAGYRDVLGMWTHAECADRHDSAAAELFRTASQDSEKEGGEDGN